MARSFRFGTVLALMVLVHVAGPRLASANVVREWNAIAVQTAIAGGNNPFQQARTLSIVQLAVFEAVNAVTGEYEPYLGTITAAEGASAEAAAIAAAHAVLKAYFSAAGATLDAVRAASLDQIPDGSAKDDGIAVGEAAAAAMMALRANDGSSPPLLYDPGPDDPGLWQATPICPINPATGQQAGVLAHWGQMTPFGIPSAEQFMPGPPPAFSSNRYRKDYEEVARVGSSDISDRPDGPRHGRAILRRDVAFVRRQLHRSPALGRRVTSSLSEDAQAFALINMSINDALIVSFKTKYHYLVWRPETAIVRRRRRTATTRPIPITTYVPYIITPCFPSYPSNHAVRHRRRDRGVCGASTGPPGTTSRSQNPAVAGVVLEYRNLEDDRRRRRRRAGLRRHSFPVRPGGRQSGRPRGGDLRGQEHAWEGERG